jgi:NitT/TauT family transport system substrate-binding protein
VKTELNGPNKESHMHRRRFLTSAAAAAGAVTVGRFSPARAAREILVAEPVHSTGYLPLYIAVAKGYFEDITVKMITIETGAGHTNAVLSGQAFAFIGGPEHNAFAKAKGAELRSIIACVDRGNIYFCAAPGHEPPNSDWANYFRGKTIAIGPFGGTPNSILRYLLGKWKLDAKRDVTLIETANSATIAVVRGKQAQIGEATEPYVTQGVRNKVWGEPFFNVPKELGPYAYSTINVRLDTIRKEPELVRAFVRGMAMGLKFLYANPAEASEIAKAQFPTMPIEDLRATLDRSFKDELWSRDGFISPQSWVTASAVVREAGILKSDVKYEEIIDMSFVESIRATL